jgi:hypothetical protein
MDHIEFIEDMFKQIWPDRNVKCWWWPDRPDEYIIRVMVSAERNIWKGFIYQPNMNRVVCYTDRPYYAETIHQSN